MTKYKEITTTYSTLEDAIETATTLYMKYQASKSLPGHYAVLRERRMENDSYIYTICGLKWFENKTNLTLLMLFNTRDGKIKRS